MKTLIQITILIFFCLATFTVHAQLPPRINMPGTLKDANGAAVEDGDYTLIFRLYAQPNGGTPRWSETATVNVKGGLYNHLLGSVSPLSAELFDVTLFLGIKLGTFELQPRTELTYAPYTFASSTALFANKVICSGAIGDIKYSILNPTQFTAKNGECWVPMDGSNRPGSKLANILGTANVAPDASGMFMRGHEYNDGQDPDRNPSSPIATLQNGTYKSHSHTGSTNTAGDHSHSIGFNITEAVNSGSYSKRRLALSTGTDMYQADPTGAHTHTLTINTSGGTENRPKNLNLYVYIRVN